MISKKIAEELNKQLGREFFSSHFYLSMSAYSETLGLKGFSHWFMLKYTEENQHAMKFYKYILDQGATVKLTAIKQPESEFESPLSMFEATLAHEKKVTQHINELVDAAVVEKDYATQIFLHWFITEQIEEEATVSEIISKIKLVGGKGDGLFMIDTQLGQTASTHQEM